MGAVIRSAIDQDGRRKYLSRSEGEKFVAKAAQLPRPQAFFCLTLYYSGCRISEALNLRGCDFDYELQRVLIRSLKKRDRKSIRRIPLPEFIVRELTKQASTRHAEPIWSFSRTTGWRIVKHVMNAAEIYGIHASPKGLRHGFGVRGALEQIPLNIIQTWMGHADATTTAIYLAVQGEEERTLMKRTW